jgi:hypothetical protein
VLFLAHVGLPSALACTRGIATEVAPCTAVVLDELPLAISDQAAEREARAFFDACSIRAYVGVPVMLRGVVVGALATADPAPRTTSPLMVARLARLARELGDILGERRSGPRPTIDTIPDPDGVRASLAHDVAELVGAAGRVSGGASALVASASPLAWSSFVSQIDETLLSHEELAVALDDLERAVPRLEAIGVATRSFRTEVARVRRASVEISPLLRLAQAARAGLVDGHLAERSVALLPRGTGEALTSAAANVASAARLMGRNSQLGWARLAP